MSEKMGPLTFGKRNEQIFLGREFAQHKDYSEQTAIEIDAEVRRIVMENYAKARLLLQENLAALNAMAAALLEKESLDGPDIDRIIAENRGGAAGRPGRSRWSRSLRDGIRPRSRDGGSAGRSSAAGAR